MSIIQNYPGPGVLRMHYTTEFTGTHVMNLNVALDSIPDIGEVWTSITLLNKDTSTQSLFTFKSALQTDIKTLWDSAASIDLWEFYTVDPGTFDYTFISSETGVGAGTGTGTPGVGSYNLYTLRTVEGGTARVTLFETVINANIQRGLADLTMNENATIAELVASDTPVVGLDTSYVAQFERASYGQNEKLWRSFYRP